MYAVVFSFKDRKINLCCTQLFCLGTKWGRTLRIETKNGSVGEIRESQLPVVSQVWLPTRFIFIPSVFVLVIFPFSRKINSLLYKVVGND